MGNQLGEIELGQRRMRHAISKESAQPVRFIGSKANLLNEITSFIKSKVEDKGTFGDFFCGSAVVSGHFKKQGYRIIANDNLSFCTTFAKSILYNDEAPNFSKLLSTGEVGTMVKNTLTDRPYDRVQSYLNDIQPLKGFIYKHYTPEGTKGNEHQRKYFTEENAERIDAIREKIEEWNKRELLTEAEYALLISDLLRATNKVANIAGTYGFFLKEMKDPRVKKKLRLNPTEFISGANVIHEVYCEDANQLTQKKECDIIYLDPPYNWRHYGAYYHLLETINRWDNPRVQGKSGLRQWNDTKSRYSYREQALAALLELVKNARTKHIFISYNSEGFITHSQMSETLSIVGSVSVKEIIYQRYKSNNGGSGKTRIIERIYYVKKKN